MTLQEITRNTRARHSALFAQAEALSSRMGSAIALNTCHAPRLRTLRRKLRAEIAECNPIWLRKWIADFEAAVDAECRAAHAATTTEPVGRTSFERAA